MSGALAFVPDVERTHQTWVLEPAADHWRPDFFSLMDAGHRAWLAEALELVHPGHAWLDDLLLP